MRYGAAPACVTVGVTARPDQSRYGVRCQTGTVTRARVTVGATAVVRLFVNRYVNLYIAKRTVRVCATDHNLLLPFNY